MDTISTSREIKASPEEVFAAFSDPQRLAQWWGPEGFTNTFSVCEFRPGGNWTFVMHGPDGNNYDNESVFLEIVPLKKIVVDHICEPKFVLTIQLEPSQYGTLVAWSAKFESDKFVTNALSFLKAATEQNLDRLVAEVLRD